MEGEREGGPAGSKMSPARLAIGLVLAFWLVTPFVLLHGFAQDAVPFVVAGDLARSEPEAVYSPSGDLFTLEPSFAERSCEVSPEGTECEDENVAFVSPPPALPLAYAVSLLGPTWGPLAMRLLVSCSLIAGCVAVGRRLLARDPDQEGLLAVLLVLLTPMFAITIALGQNSPLLFLSAAVGLAVAGRSKGRALAVGALWGLTVAFKLTPAVLAGVLVLRRRWRVLGAGLGTVVALAGAALALGGPSMWSRFARAAGELSDDAGRNPYNGSLEAFVHAVAGGVEGTAAGAALTWGLRIALLVAVVAVLLRVRDEDGQWAVAWLGSFLLVPLVWWHYLWVSYAAVGITMASTRSRSWVARPVLLVPMALAGLPLSIVNGSGHSVPVAQFAFLVVSLAWSAWLALDVGAREPESAPALAERPA